MENWILFPRKNTANKVSGPECIDMLLYFLSQDQRCLVSKEEWNTLIPESRERLQGPSLGFCCGSLSGSAGTGRDLCYGLPPVRIRKYASDCMILQKAWNNDFACTVRNSWSIPEGFILHLNSSPVAITVSGMLSLEGSFFVWGSKGTRFSKYRVPASAGTFVIEGKKR